MIIPIGAQNAYVLNQGIKRNHHLTTATICSILDMIFISLGIFGGGAILSQNEILLTSVTLGGIAFLSFYGLLSLKSAFKSDSDSESKGEVVARGRRTVILGALAVTGQFEGHDRIAFALGTMMASFVWFYTLSIGAAKLGPTLSKPRVKKGIDIAVAVMMFTIAYILASELIEKYW
jgi:L-lysine exporter family protein LysE/ArgO